MPEHVIGLVGTGRMGTPIGAHLLAAGHSLVVHDRNDAATAFLTSRGARSVASPRAVADAAGIVFMSLPTPDIVRAVALGPDGVIEGGSVRIVVDLSTTGPRMARIVFDGLAARQRAA